MELDALRGAKIALRLQAVPDAPQCVAAVAPPLARDVGHHVSVLVRQHAQAIVTSVALEHVRNIVSIPVKKAVSLNDMISDE